MPSDDRERLEEIKEEHEHDTFTVIDIPQGEALGCSECMEPIAQNEGDGWYYR